MPNTIRLHDWLRYIDDEYLSTFVKDGGSSIKFAVTPDELRPELNAVLLDKCRQRGYVFVKLDAVTLRPHLPQYIYIGLARQIEWRLLARRRILSLAEARRYDVAGIDPEITGNVFEAIASVNGLESGSVLQALRPEIERNVLKSPELARDFRVAMNHLCLHEDTHSGGEYTGEPILDWLTGMPRRSVGVLPFPIDTPLSRTTMNTRISDVRPFSIYTPINRTTARNFIESTLHWIRHAGYAGTVIVLDNSRVTLARNPKLGPLFYTRAMAMEHYELLREFIDRIDRLAGTLLVVATNNDFLDESPKGVYNYEALYTRIMEDVRDQELVNPVAPLVRLS